MNGVQVRCLHEPGDILALGEQINALNLASERPDPFSTCEFYANFVQRGLSEPQSESQLWFLAAFLGTELIGYLALKRVTRKVLGVSSHGLEFLVGHEADRPHLVARPAHLAQVSAALYAYLHGRRREWSVLELQGQTADSPLDPARLAARLPGCLIRAFPNWDNCTIQVRWKSVQQYVQALSKNMRSDLRRRLRRLLVLGNVELLQSSDPRATPALFDLYCNIEARSWKSQTEVAIGGSVRAEYLKGLLDARQPMRIVIQILLLDGVPIAGLISGSFAAAAGKTLYALHLAFDSRLSAASPGSAVLLLGMRHAIEGGHASMNLLGGFSYYKTRWLAEATPTHSIQIYRIGSLMFWRRLVGDLRRRLHRGAPQIREWFNPLRRQHSAVEQPENSPASCEINVTEAERNRLTAKIAQAQLGLCERLSTAEIAASASVLDERRDPSLPPAFVARRRYSVA